MLTVIVTVPVCILPIAVMLTVYTCQGRHCTFRKKKRQNIEEPLSECNLVNSGKSLKDLIYDMTTSGSGSGMYALLRRLKRLYLLMNSQENRITILCSVFVVQ